MSVFGEGTVVKKIKIFLGGYVNFPNSQNINCDNIAKNLNKDKFEVHTMYTSKKPIDKKLYKKMDIHLHKLVHHRFIWYWSKLLVMRAGSYDIYYLPKAEPMDRVFAKKYKNTQRAMIASVEGVITPNTNNDKGYRNYYMRDMDNCFAISECIAESIKKYWGIRMPVLPLGVAEPSATNESIEKKSISTVIWVGNIKANKRPQYLIKVAKEFPELNFFMIGDGDMMKDIERELYEKNIKNVKMTGRLPNNEVYQYMVRSDILLMTSEYEGLPKVIQEAAQCKVPTIYINQNYDVDFIEDGKNGYGVKSIIEVIDILSMLLNDSEKYVQMSESAYQVIQEYTWEHLILQYEEFFKKALEEKKKVIREKR